MLCFITANHVMFQNNILVLAMHRFCPNHTVAPRADADQLLPHPEEHRGGHGRTIEAIGKYQLISSHPINHYTIVPITHVS